MKNRFFLLACAVILVGCGGVTPIPATGTPTSIALFTPEPTPIHPELEVISPENISHLEQIGQWGQGNVHGVALSGDSNRIAVSTATGIYLYDRKTVDQVGYIDVRIGNDNDVERQTCSTSGSLTFSPDGSTLAIADADIKLWDLKTNSLRKVIENKIEDPDSIITEIHFSSDGSRIFGVQKRAFGYPCYTGWGSLVIYAVETGELIFRRDYSRYEEGPNVLFLEENGISHISYFNTQKVGYSFLEVDLRTGDILGERQSPAIYSMNGTAAVTYKWVNADDDGKGYSQAHILDLSSFEDIEILSADVEFIHHSNRMIVLEQQKLTVRTLGGAVTCSEHINAEAADAFLPDMFSLDGSIAVGWNSYGDRAGDIRIWDLERCTISSPILIFPEVARKMNVSSDARSVLTGSNAGYTFHIFDSQTGQLRFSLSGFDAQFSADGQQVFVVESAAVNAYDVGTGKYLYPVLKIDADYMTDIAVSPDGRFLVINNTSAGDSKIVSIGSNTPVSKIPASLANYPYFSQDGNLMAVINRKQAASEFRFWDVNTGKELSQLKRLIPDTSYNDPSFNSNFSQVATYGTDGYYKFVYVWNIPESSLANVLTQPFPSGNRSIGYLEFMPDDRIFFARGMNPDAFLFWDVSTGDLLSEVPAEIHDSELGNAVAFSPDGRLVLVIDSDGTIHVWGVKSR